MCLGEKIIIVDRSDSGVVIIRLNRPAARNALTTELLSVIADELEAIARDSTVKVVVITGSDKVFAAGADLKEMAALDMVGVVSDVRPSIWTRIASFPKPLIAAVNGFALGGGFELVMQADIVVAGDNAQFGLPEINLGIIPGAGGTQRLIRTVGKSLAMKMVLAGEFIGAQEAKAVGLVTDVTLPELTLERALKIAQLVSEKSPLAVEQAKDVLLQAFETHLDAGIKYERKAFIMLSGSADRNEGIAAFLDKRRPVFEGR